MRLISKDFNIEEIRYGHDSEGYAMSYLIKNKNIDSHINDIKKDTTDAWNILNAHEDGFECGIKWLASYLKEYGIEIELHDKIIPTIEKEHWYSGEIVEKV